MKRVLLICIATFFTMQMMHAQGLPGKKMKQKSVTIEGYALKVGDSLELSEGTQVDGNFMHISTVAGLQRLPLGASMKGDALVIDHFRYVAGKAGEMYVVVAKVGRVKYMVDYVKALKAGEVTPPPAGHLP